MTARAPFAVVFPGQGSQSVGMGLEIAEAYTASCEVYELAEQVTGLAISRLSFSGPEEELYDTSNTQPALLATNLAIYELFKRHFPTAPAFFAGHSAGEYAALAAAGVLSYEDAFRLIQVRGKLMSQMEDGGMAALKNVSPEQVQSLCDEAAVAGGVLVPANWNSPAQTVISGDFDSIEAAIDLAFEREIDVVPLAVSGAFHSPLMGPAAEKFAAFARDIPFADAVTPVIANVTAKPVTDGALWADLLERQITSPVLWEPSVRCLYDQGVRVFVEIGPGVVLSKLIRRILPDATAISVQDLASLEAAVRELESVLNNSLQK